MIAEQHQYMFVPCATTTGSSFWCIMDIAVVASRVSACSFSPVLCYMILSLKSSGSKFSCYFHWLWKPSLCTTFAFVTLYSSLEKSGFFHAMLIAFLWSPLYDKVKKLPLYSSVWSKPKLKEVS